MTTKHNPAAAHDIGNDLEQAMLEIDSVIKRLSTLEGYCNTPSPVHGRNLAKAIAEVRSDLQSAVAIFR